jgi:hypothetical protein
MCCYTRSNLTSLGSGGDFIFGKGAYVLLYAIEFDLIGVRVDFVFGKGTYVLYCDRI